MKLKKFLPWLALLICFDIHANCEKQADTALIFALHKGDMQTVSKLIKSGHSPNETGKFCFTPLESAHSVEAITMLLDAGANIDQQDGAGATALLDATRNQKIEVMRILLQRGANTNIYNESGRTPLIAATEIGWIEGITTLLDAGADINKHQEYGIGKSLVDAILSPILSGSIFANKDPCHGWSGYNSPLLSALANQRFDSAKLLIERGADAKLINPYSENTALILSIDALDTLKGNECKNEKQVHQIAALLLMKGLRPNTKNSCGETARSIAMIKNCPTILKLLSDEVGNESDHQTNSRNAQLVN